MTAAYEALMRNGYLVGLLRNAKSEVNKGAFCIFASGRTAGAITGGCNE